MVAAANFFLYTYLNQDGHVFILLMLLANTLMIHSASNYVVSYILFPFANYYMKLNYHLNLNKSMINEINKNFQKGNSIIQDTMKKDEFVLNGSFKEYKTASVQIKKMCDYAALFAGVNQEIIDRDLDKKRRGKRTSRYPVTDIFVRSTECMKKIAEVLSFIRVVSITEIRHKDGTELPPEEQEMLKTPNKLRTIYEHFYELNDMERNFVDLREYKLAKDFPQGDGP